MGSNVAWMLSAPAGAWHTPDGIEPEPGKRHGIRVVPYDAVAGSREFTALDSAVEAAKSQVPIAARFALADAAKAHERLAKGAVLGKIVLRSHRHNEH
jgi:NADPH2:quinone reductase